jgi:hypothetical protein
MAINAVRQMYDKIRGTLGTDLVPQVANATPTNQNATATNQAATATMVASVKAGHVTYVNPIAPSANAGACTLVADVLAANGAQVIAAQPDFPRKLLLFITDGDSSISAGTLDLVGVGASGEAVSESIDLTGGTASKTSTKVYASLTSATVADLTGNGAGDNIALGVAGALGLVGQKTPASAAFAVHKADVDSADETVGTVDATAGSIVPTTAADGTKTFDFWYTFEVSEIQNSHNHTQDAHTHTQDAHTHTVS